ncbi:LexA family transcriptional regulator [Oceanibacterium hippocampi]|uniref:Helix-turn-helix protein n=1 Tax=Oceanibacterium hippocampi TaxID=745714 RepID=A0A1Y5S5S6_9PROT|nr:LexA family transcriptional regulator [Oceanibacterium hippocampi]SLN31967.1 helix-turn-helix protein [Oceanibacterium hippocampi]
MDFDKLQRLIEQKLRASGKSQRRLSQEAGLHPDAVRNVLRGRKPSYDRLARILRALDIAVDTIGEPIDRPRAGESIQKTERNHDNTTLINNSYRAFSARGDESSGVPVRGIQDAKGGGRFMSERQSFEIVNRPSLLRGVEHSYAVYVCDDTMVHRFLPGEIVFVNPYKPLTDGCFVVIQMAGEGAARYLIKQYLGRSGDALRLRQLSPLEDLVLSREAIVAAHRIVASQEHS